jgi:TolB-like protein/Flp pilus assembly protein TadD/DNA-binding winged helix-turn-helix (wHTH) protein
MDEAAGDKQESEWAGYRVDDLIIDIGSQRVMRGTEEIPLPQRSFEFFLALARAAPNVLSVDQLMERVWPGLVVGPETVSQRVKVVRDALGDDSQAPRYIAGVRGRGYRMVAHVEPLARPIRPEQSPAPTSTTEPPVLPGEPDAIAHAEASSIAVPAPIVPPVTGPDPANLQSGSLSHPVKAVRAPSKTLAIILALLLLGAAGLGVAVYLGWIGSGSASTPSRNAPGSRPPKTIAVLPLIDISPGGGNEYLGDGLAEELTDRLTRIPGLRVAARTSAFAFKNKADDVRKIGQSLSVQHVLEGSVRRDGDRLRVTAQLIDAQSGFHIWSQSYDRTWQDVFDIQDDISRSIVQVLELVLSSEMAERLENATTTNLAAFDLYLAGLSKLHQQANPTQLDEAERIFKAALEVDPNFARAHAGLCETYATAFERAFDPAMASKAEASCNQALKMDASLREVETALARLYVISGRAEQAVAIFQRLLGRDPHDADSYIGLARAYEKLQRLVEAESTYRRAIEVEPSYANTHADFGIFLFNHGRIEEAVHHNRRVTELRPTSARGFVNLGGVLQMAGDYKGATVALEKALALEPTRGGYSNLGSLYYFLGRFTDAEKMYRKASEMAISDHRARGFLADALYQIEGRRAEAREEYGRAIAFARRELEVSPKDAVTWANLAYYYARTGDAAQVKQCAEHALQNGPNAFYVHYYLSLSALEIGDENGALNALEKAVALGYPLEFVRAGPEFLRLRSHERFKRLIASPNRQPAG